ncbi:hypothetical protein ACFL4A_02745 [bacterium]
MKKVLLMFLVLSLANAACAEKLRIKPWVGYTSVALGDFHDALNKARDIFIEDKNDQYDEVSASVKNAHGAAIIGVDFDYAITENILVGPRISYIDVPTIESKISEKETDIDPLYGTLIHDEVIKEKYDLSLLPITVGIKYEKMDSNRFSFNMGLNMGLGLAKLNYELHTNSLYKVESDFSGDYYRERFSIDKQKTYVGACFVTDVSVGGTYKFNSTFSLGANIGYRYAKVQKMKLSKDYYDYYRNDEGDEYSYAEKKGDTIKNSEDNDIEFDFSGVTLTCGLNMAF